ncbi:MinD/ParA family ATP-binding protein [Solicola gregarius]|uniref:MinD-like ATPase involved in chromosome partitioning or flagellar assembly n=1 Tax=Solicola gregarius TaxID=2908642 RepID=A0AA46TGI3_9ACTN|nr:hypothetical protein [Solicola gregarius]UYM04942.1 hypothetical protein L0C25_20845 [Solicola gregarius]
MTEQDTPDEAELEEQRKASAQQAAADLDRMGIDPRALGLDTPPPRDAPSRPLMAPAEAPRAEQRPPLPAQPASVTPLRPEYASQPAPPAPQPPPPRPPMPPQSPLAYPPTQQPPVAAPPMMPATASRPRTPVEELLARTAGDIPAPSRTGGFLRTMTAGLVTPDSAEASAHERELVAALRTRQTERRVVAFFAGKGGVGTTTVVAGVGTALAALREEHTVAVDVRAGTASLGQIVGVDAPVTVRRFLNDGDDARVAQAPTGLHVLDGVGWEQRLRRTDVSSAVERLGADHTFTLLDVGNDASEIGHAAVARSDQTVIVASAGRTGAAALEVATARLAHTDPFAVERAVYAIVCQHDQSYRQVHRETVRRLAIDPMRVVVVPPDEVLMAGRGFDPSAVRASTRTAMLRIGAALALSGGRQ